ncbi:MAG: MFS transporter [Ignavibacteriae bacterium]|nr:MFS transporter [Ignavibacteriota bacterium]
MTPEAANEHRVPLWTRDFSLHFAASFLVAVALNFVIVLVPVFAAREFSASGGDVGLLTAVFMLTAVLSRPYLGFLLDRYGRRIVLLIALAFFSLLNAAHALVGSLGALLAIRALLGFPWGATQTATITAAVDLIPESRRGEGLAFFGLTFTLAGTVGPLASLGLLDYSSFDTVFLTAAGIILAAGCIAVFTRHAVIRDAEARLSLQSLLEPRVAWLAAATMLTTTLWGAVISFMPLYADEQGLPSAGVYFTLDALGTMASRIGSARLFDRYGPRPILIAAYLLMISSMLLLGIAPTQTGYAASAILLGVGFGIAIPAYQTMAMNLVEPERRGAANGTLYSAFDIGIGGGALSLGALADSAGFRTMFTVQSVLLLIPAALFLIHIIPSYQRRMRAAHEETTLRDVL